MSYALYYRNFVRALKAKSLITAPLKLKLKESAVHMKHNVQLLAAVFKA